MNPTQALEQRGQITAQKGGDETQCRYQPGSWQREAWMKGFTAEKDRQLRQRNSKKKPSQTMQRCMAQIHQTLLN